MEILDPAQAHHGEVPGHPSRRISRQRAGVALFALLFASLICVALVFLRQMFVGYASYGFLIWNLTLAWVPLVFSFFTYRLHVSGRRRGLLFVSCAAVWFVFFPNAPYMVTDFVHISPIHIAPEWFDVITVISCAWTGLSLGFLSLYLMQEIARERLGRVASWIFVLVMLAFGSVGVFCGRFLRWNSWDVFRHPRGVLRSVHPFHRFAEPGDMVFLTTLFLFLLLSYSVMFAFTHLHARDRH
jgi:uncharacterized membrane protein